MFAVYCLQHGLYLSAYCMLVCWLYVKRQSVSLVCIVPKTANKRNMCPRQTQQMLPHMHKPPLLICALIEASVHSPSSDCCKLLPLQSKAGSGGSSTGEKFQKQKDEVVGESKENIKEAEDTLKVSGKLLHPGGNSQTFSA